MGGYKIIIKETAEKDFLKHETSGNKQNLVKISKIIEELRNQSFQVQENPNH